MVSCLKHPKNCEAHVRQNSIHVCLTFGTIQLLISIHQQTKRCLSHPVWLDWAIYWTLGNFLKPLATIILPKSLTFLGNFCKGVKSYQFSSEIIFWQLLAIFFWSHWIHTRNLNPVIGNFFPVNWISKKKIFLWNLGKINVLQY